MRAPELPPPAPTVMPRWLEQALAALPIVFGLIRLRAEHPGRRA
ncbi:MAG: hypothetical protein U1F43_17385 [Myxococcota bacterium]